jgi:hypothetical protein
MNFQNIVIGKIRDGISGLTSHEILCFMLGFYKSASTATAKRNAFTKWMDGQTVASLSDGTIVYYTHDFISFMNGEPVTD